MDCYNIFVDIVIPLVSAFIGGLVTLIGIIITINHERKCRKEDEIKLYKPFFVSLTAYDEKTKRSLPSVCFESGIDNGMYRLIDGYIENLDISHFTIEKVVIGNISYYPTSNAVVEKNSVLSIQVYGDKKVIESATLHIYDVLENKYIYDMIFEEEAEKGCRIVEKYTLSRKCRKH